ncbi:MAG: hypothetical protein WBF17_08870, partial [Phycisphaerae bacterium]
MTTAIQSNVVPEAIVKKLNDLIWRARLVMVLRGAMATLAMAVVSVLAIMAIDLWVVIFSDWARWALSMTGLGLTILVALWFIVRPLARSFTLTGIARLIESRHPELHERISSTVELLTTEDGPELRGSDALIAALAAEAVMDARTVRPSKEINFEAAVPYLIAAGAVIAVLTSVIAIWPAEAQRLFQRALLANVSRVSRTALKVTRISAPDLKEWGGEGFDYVMMAGRRLHVELLVSDSAVTSAQVLIGPLAGGNESPLAMTRMPDALDGSRRFAVTCPPAVGSFRLRLHAGDALTKYYGVKVVEQPQISRIDLRYAYPAYTCRDVELRPSAAGDVAAVPGTVATITARTNKPVATAEFLLDGTGRPGQLSTAPDGAAICTFQVRITKNMKTRWSARLEDEYGFVNEPTEYPIKAVRDKRPGVDVLVPNATRLKLKPTDSLPIAYRLKDDFGLTAAAMLVEVDGQAQTPKDLPVPAGAKPSRQVEGQTALDLSALPLEGARQITFRLRATDILPPELMGPQEGFSELFTIQLDVKAPSFTEQIVLAEELRLREVLKQVLEKLEETKKDSAPLRHMVPKAQTVTAAIIERVDRMRKHLASADAMLREVIGETAEGIYAAFTEKLNTLADDHVAKALDLAGQVKLTDKRKERSALADEADFQVDRSIALVKELLKELGVLTEQLTRAMELQDLAVRQDELAEALAEMLQDANEQAPPEGVEMMSPEEWQKAQEQLAGELAEMTRQTPGALEAQLRKDTQRAKDLLAEARKLARDQKKLKSETEQAVKVEKIDDALAKLAEKQEQLAKDAAATEAAADQAKPMAQAAEDIKADKLEDAVGKQQQAEKQLDQRADLGADAKAAESLADKADQIAKQQEQVAKQAQAAKKDLDTAEAKAADADKQAGAAKKQGAEAADRAKQAMGGLQQKQMAVAQQAKELHKEATANPATANEANRNQPARAMEEAAREAAKPNPVQAASQARSAAQQAEQLAKDLGNAARNAAKAAQGAPQQEKAEKAKQAQSAAQAAQKAGQIAQSQKGLAEQFDQEAQKGRGEQTRTQQAAQKATSQQNAAKQQAASAKRQASQLTGQQQGLAQRASELVREAARAGEKAKQAAQQHNPTNEMKQAARAMQASQPPEAAQKATEAAEKARQLAQALRKAAEDAPKGAKDQAPQLADMSRRQADIRKETEKLLAQRKGLERTAMSSEFARLQREQAELAREAAELSDGVKKDAPQNDRIDTQAAQAAKDAADQLAARDAAKAAESATEAGEKLSEMGDRLNQEIGRQATDEGKGAEQPGEQPGEESGKPSGEQSGKPSGEQSGKPSGEQVAAQGSTAQEPDQVGDSSARQMTRKAELADTAEDLGQRQKQLASQIRALAEGDPTAMAAAKQAGIAERTGELAEDVGRIQEHAEELIPDEPARQDAAEANKQLGRAMEAQGKASEALEAGKASEALGPEEQSGQALTAA